MDDKNRTTLLQCFLHWEQTQPDAIQFTEPRPDGTVVDYTWRQVGDEARRMATYLRSLDLPAKSNLVILGRNSAHWIIADLAIWMAGHVSVPLYTTMGADTARYVFDHCSARLLFIGKLDGKHDGWNEIRTVLPEGVPIVSLPMAPELPERAQAWSAIVEANAPLQDVYAATPEELATIIYTSGSTGLPKGVMHSFGAMHAYAEGAGDFTHLTTADRLLSYLPLAHAAERAFVESNSIHGGCRVYFSDSLETFPRDLQRAQPTLFISMPRLWTKFHSAINARLPPEQQAMLGEQSEVGAALRKQVLTMLGLHDVRIAFTGSAPLPAQIVDWYRTLGLELLDVYGMTEDFCYSHYSRPGQVRLGYCGQALPGVERRIADDGEILIRAPTRMMGYYKQPLLTAQSVTEDGFFHTGDRGEVDELGRLKITGRVKELFKTSKGKYVAPAPIENRFTHPKIEAVCVTGPSYPQPFALVMLTADARKDLDDAQARAKLRDDMEALLDKVNESLEDHEKLNHIVIVDDMWSMDNGFLTPTLKIRRTQIEARYLEKATHWAELGQKVVFETA